MEHPARSSPDLSTAFHEAGHVAAHLYFDITFEEVTIERTGFYAGRVLSKEVWRPNGQADLRTLRYDHYTNSIITIKLAGPAARAKHQGKTSADPGDYSDANQALTIIRQLFAANEETSKQAFLEFKIKEAFDFINDQEIWAFITTLADQLVKKRTLRYAECRSLLTKEFRTRQ
jgi:hypothetical protein